MTQITGRAGLQHVGNKTPVGVGRQRQHLHAPSFSEDPFRSHCTIEPRHADVHDDNTGMKLSRQFNGALPVADIADPMPKPQHARIHRSLVL